MCGLRPRVSACTVRSAVSSPHLRGATFPVETERLLLNVAANQATIGLQQARLLSQERRIAEELDALRERERESHLIVDSIPGLVALLTATGDVEFVNRQLFEYFGQTLEELQAMGDERYDSSRGPAPRHRGVHALDRLRQSIRNRAAFPTVGWRLSLVSRTAAFLFAIRAARSFAGACC